MFKDKLLKRVSFSKPQFMVFVLTFALIGGYAIYRSFAANNIYSTAVNCSLYASPAGNDTNSGTISSPYLTVQKLFDSIAPGQTGCLRGGSYSPASGSQYVLRGNSSGSSGMPKTISSYPTETATLTGAAQVIYIPDTSNYVTLLNLKIISKGGDTTVSISGDNIIIADSEMTNNYAGNTCVQFGSHTSGAALNGQLLNNRIHDCGTNSLDHCVYDNTTTNFLVRGNTIWNCYGFAMHIFPDAHGTIFEYNTTDGGSPTIRGGLLLGGDDGYSPSNSEIRYNIITYGVYYNVSYCWTGSGCTSPPGTNNVVHDNCLYAGAPANFQTPYSGYTQVNNLQVDPLFINRSNHDYTLQAGSQCTSYGASPILPPPGDLNGDAHVTITDLSILLSHYGQSATTAQGDINNDGTCNIVDLSILLSHYGT